MSEYTVLLQYIITGATIGSVYAMVAVGFNIIYNVTDVINFAQGEFVMLGGLVMVFLQISVGLHPMAAFVLTIAIVTGIGFLMDRFAIRPIKKPTVLTLIIASIACSMLIKGTAMYLWGKDPYDLPAFSGREPIIFFNAAIQPQSLWMLGFLIITVIFLTFFFERSIVGKAMKACAANPAAASLTGINVQFMIMLSFGLSAAIGALAGIGITPIALMEYDRGAMLAVKGFAALILGGLGSFPGAVAGGLFLGLIESFGAGYLSSGYKDAFALIVLFILLLARPSGLLGDKAVLKIKKF